MFQPQSDVCMHAVCELNEFALSSGCEIKSAIISCSSHFHSHYCTWNSNSEWQADLSVSSLPHWSHQRGIDATSTSYFSMNALSDATLIYISRRRRTTCCTLNCLSHARKNFRDETSVRILPDTKAHSAHDVRTYHQCCAKLDSLKLTVDASGEYTSRIHFCGFI